MSINKAYSDIELFDNLILDDVLFNMYLKAVQSQALGIDAVIRNKDKIIPLLRIIVTYDDDTFAYTEANKRLIILTLEKPSFWKQVFDLR